VALGQSRLLRCRGQVPCQSDCETSSTYPLPPTFFARADAVRRCTREELHCDGSGNAKTQQHKCQPHCGQRSRHERVFHSKADTNKGVVASCVCSLPPLPLRIAQPLVPRRSEAGQRSTEVQHMHLPLLRARSRPRTYERLPFPRRDCSRPTIKDRQPQADPAWIASLGERRGTPGVTSNFPLLRLC
jgi:hypothetical protein